MIFSTLASINYFFVESTFAVESTLTADESTFAVESALTSGAAALLQAVIKPATAKIANTFFIVIVFCLSNLLLIPQGYKR
ncbi:MAG: hypothetical protein D4R41_06190 [Sediminibacterium sp.]|nr:MAG: hypothetical protein D4R41_06190 [Sediminibacterium sp.]